MRRFAGTVVMICGMLLIAWAVQHRNEPLVAAKPKTVGPVYFGESRPLIAFASGLGALWCGWLLSSVGRSGRTPPEN